MGCRTASARTATTSLSGDGCRTVRLTTQGYDRHIPIFHCALGQRDLYFGTTDIALIPDALARRAFAPVYKVQSQIGSASRHSVSDKGLASFHLEAVAFPSDRAHLYKRDQGAAISGDLGRALRSPLSLSLQSRSLPILELSLLSNGNLTSWQLG